LNAVVHVVGAGLAGLSAAVSLAACGIRVQVHEGAAQAGGRCRSYHDPQLGMMIDNGNHLLLSGNHAAHRYLRTIGALGHLPAPKQTAIAFVDLRDGASWTLRPNDGPVPWWILDSSRRARDVRASDHLRLLGLIQPARGSRIDQVFRCEGAIYERLIGPFLVAALNTPTPGASAALAGAVIRRTLARGGEACRPLQSRSTLAAAFIDPALAYLGARGAQVRFGARASGLRFTGDRVSELIIDGRVLALGARDMVILAAPAWVAKALVPGLKAPIAYHSIVNAHFRIAPSPQAPRILGVIGATAEWIFAFDDRISITVSAADRIVEEDRERLAQILWMDVVRAYGVPMNMPRWQIVKERRATFAATPEQDALRPGARTKWRNLLLAGDWTATGLPATIEGAVQSGATAARLARRQLRMRG
jgi:squalene-associated FAD-dependent desaturase